MSLKKSMIIIAIILCIFLIIYLIWGVNPSGKGTVENTQREVDSNTIQTSEEKHKTEVARLKNMSELGRIKRYISNYMLFIEGGDYESAYNLLYPEFKTSYFSTLEKYTEYIKHMYPSTIVMEYGDMERQGHYFVIHVNVVDPQGEKNQFSQKFIVYEKDYDDYIISFEVV